MPNYKVLRGFCYEPGRDVYPGDVIEIEDEKGATPFRVRELLNSKKIEAFKGKDGPATSASSTTTEGRSTR